MDHAFHSAAVEEVAVGIGELGLENTAHPRPEMVSVKASAKTQTMDARKYPRGDPSRTQLISNAPRAK